MSHLNKPSEELVLDLVNEANNRNFTLDQVNIRDPAPHSYVGRNTIALAEAVPGSGYYGSDTLYYNRLDLAVKLANNDPEGLYLSIPNDAPDTTLDVAERINQLYELQLGPDDIVLAPVDSSTLPANVTITAKPGSLAWVGSKEMILVPDRPLWPPTFSSFTLDGFEFPNADVSGLTEPVTLKDQLSVQAVNALLPFDWNLPANHVTISNNTEIRLELAVRDGDGTLSTTPDSDNAYTLQLGGEATWSLLIGAMLPAGQVVTDLYNVCMTITCPDGSSTLFWVQRVNGIYYLVNEQIGAWVPLSKQAADASSFQSLVEISYLLDLMGKFTVAGTNAFGASSGVYSVRMQARRKNSVAPRVLATILIKAYNNTRPADTSLVTEYNNAQELTFDWTDLNGWTNTHLYISNRRIFGAFAGPFVASYALYPLSVAANECAVAHGEITMGAGQANAIYIGFCFGEDAFGADGISNNVFLGGLGTANNNPQAYIGANFAQGGGVNVLDAAVQATGTYRVTVAIDPENLSVVIRSQDGTKEWVKTLPRSAAPNGGVVTSLRIWNGSTSANTTRYLGVLGVRKSFTPFRTKTNAAGTIEGSTERVVHRNVTDGWRIQFPKTMDGTAATPVVVYFHQSISGNRNNPMTESRWTALRQAFSDRGYILLSCDDAGDRWGNRASLRNHADMLRWLRKRVNVGKVFVLGYSMGGLSALNAVANRALGPVAACALISPVADMSLLYDDAQFTAAMQSSWNVSTKADLLARTKGFNPLFTSAAKFAKIPFVFNVAVSGDTVVNPALNTVPFEAAIRSVAKSTVINSLGTGHGAPSQFDVTSIAGLFDANR